MATHETSRLSAGTQVDLLTELFPDHLCVLLWARQLEVINVDDQVRCKGIVPEAATPALVKELAPPKGLSPAVAVFLPVPP